MSPTTLVIVEAVLIFGGVLVFGSALAAEGISTRVDAKIDMKASTGFIVEGEYAVTPGWSLKGRYVYETFRYKDFPEADKVKGDHLAVQSVWYLN